MKKGSENVGKPGKVASRGVADKNRVNSAALAVPNEAAYVHPLTGLSEDQIYALTPNQLAEVFLRGDKAFRDEFIRSVKVSFLLEMWIMKHQLTFNRSIRVISHYTWLFSRAWPRGSGMILVVVDR